MSALNPLNEVVKGWMSFGWSKREAIRWITRSRLSPPRRGNGNRASKRAAKQELAALEQWWDSLRLTEEDVNHLAERFNEGRIYDRNQPVNFHD